MQGAVMMNWFVPIASFGLGAVLALFAGRARAGKARAPKGASRALGAAGGEQKMVLVVRQDLGMKAGKVAAQCSHAAVGAYSEQAKRGSSNLKAWEAQGQPKVCLKASGLEELERVKAQAEGARLPTFIVQDAGRTQIDPGSSTVVAVGPGPSSKIDSVTGHLKLL